jgi:hypothetical protein
LLPDKEQASATLSAEQVSLSTRVGLWASAQELMLMKQPLQYNNWPENYQ